MCGQGGLGAVPCVGWLVVSTDLLRVWAQAIVTADDGGPVKKKFVASEEWHGSMSGCQCGSGKKKVAF